MYEFNLNNNHSFTREHTQIAKGIAILLMVYHHLFVEPARLGGKYISVINLAGFDLQSVFANFAKICVGIFLFLSGIGLYYTLSKYGSLKQMYKKAGQHALKFMLNFWIIALLLFPIGISKSFFSLTLKDLFYIVFASHGKVLEWWFVRQYIAVLVYAPLFVNLFRQTSAKKRVLPLIAVFFIWLVLRIAVKFIPADGASGIIRSVFSEYLWCFDNYACLIVFISGILCARYDIVTCFMKEKSIKDKMLLSLFFCFAATIIRVRFSNSPESMKVDCFVVPMFILPLTSLLYGTKCSRIMMWLGKHSTNIWLTHTFWCYYYWQKIVLIPRYSVLIYIWLLILSLASSYIINLIYVPVSNLLFSREHRFSYNNYLFFKINR